MPKCTIPMLPCDSSQLKEFGYDQAAKTLAIRFKGKSGERFVYTYAGVPQEVASGMRAADADPEQSVGKYFGEHIKGQADKYPFTKIDELADEEAQA